MSWGYGWRPYVPVAKRRANAARELAKLGKKTGQQADPVVLKGRNIAASFWGKAWCDNLEAYSDFENRLPRGRTYVRNGSVVDLQIAKGTVTARVSGSDLYRVEVTIRPLASKLWAAIQKECAGKIDSLLELLQGRLSAGVMQVVTRPKEGFFPTPSEIKMKCSCPDSADMCKHIAATLYGVGARLDTRPELLFLLRGVDPEELIAGVTGAAAVRTSVSVPTAAGLGAENLSEVFGIELESASGTTDSTRPDVPKVLPKKRASGGSPRKPKATEVVKPKPKLKLKTKPKLKPARKKPLG